MLTQRNVAFSFSLHFFQYEFICLAFAGLSALAKETNVNSFVPP